MRIQIVTALIAYLLLRLAQIRTGTELGLQAIARLVAKTTFQRRALTDLFEPPPDPTQNPMTNSKSPSPKSKPDSNGSSPGMTRRIGESVRLHGQPKIVRTSETGH